MCPPARRVSSSLVARAAVLAILLAVTGCAAGWEGALGHRSRQAALAGDAAGFRALMAEAAETRPKNPFDNPKQTVLSHFFDLGGHDLFFPILEEWRQRGWLDERMTCAIHRARHRALRARDPVEARRAAEVCVEQALAAAWRQERWEIDACLEDAAFLTESSTTAIAPFVARAADPSGPPAFRAGLLRGLSMIHLQDPYTRRANDPQLSEAEVHRQAVAQVERLGLRLALIVEATRVTTDPALLAAATSRGALELERASLAVGRSFLGAHILGRDAELDDLAWAWVKLQSDGPPDPRLDSLGLWDRRKEPGGASWYACTRTEVAPAGEAKVRGLLVLAQARVPDPEALAGLCRDAEGAPLPELAGPFPLAATARGVLQARARALGATRVELVLERR